MLARELVGWKSSLGSAGGNVITFFSKLTFLYFVYLTLVKTQTKFPLGALFSRV